MHPQKLKSGDEIRIIAPSLSISTMEKEKIAKSEHILTSLGFKITYSKHSYEIDCLESSSIKNRLYDLHSAFEDKNVKAIITAKGGFNSNQLLGHIDYDLITRNPKIICGYSDITALINAIYAKTGITTYLGPTFSAFSNDRDIDYTIKYFTSCLVNYDPFEIESNDNNIEIIYTGITQGRLIGGNLSTFNLLKGTDYLPNFDNAIILIEDLNTLGLDSLREFDRNLQSLIDMKDFYKIKGILIGKFGPEKNFSSNDLKQILSTKNTHGTPVISNLNFGHTHPKLTLPIGGFIEIKATNNLKIKIIEH